MRKLAPTILTLVVVFALTATAGWTQGNGGWQSGSRGRWSTVSPEDRQKVADLHQAIRTLQLEISQLRADGADPALIAQKEQERTDLRADLHNLMVSLRPAPAPRVGNQGAVNRNGKGPQARNQGQVRGQWGQAVQRGYCYMRGGNCPFAAPQLPAK